MRKSIMYTMVMLLSLSIALAPVSALAADDSSVYIYRSEPSGKAMLGDALVGERERLHDRVQQFFERLELQLRQILREAQLRQDASLRTTPEAGAALLTAFVEGRMQQFLRSRFSEPSLSAWETDWGVLSHGLFDPG